MDIPTLVPVPDSSAPEQDSFSTLFRRLGAAGPLAIVAAFMPALAGVALLWKMDIVSVWLKTHGTGAVFVYAAGFALLAGLALLPTYAQAILGGWAFGMLVGTPAALAGFLGGSLIGYEIARRASRDRFERIIDEKPKWRAVRDALVGGRGAGFWKTTGLITLIRLPPNSPFALTNLVLAGVRVPRWPYAVGTVLGMIPRTTLAVMLGAGIQGALNEESYKAAIPLKFKLGMLFVTVAVVLIIGHMANRALARVAATDPPEGHDSDESSKR